MMYCFDRFTTNFLNSTLLHIQTVPLTSLLYKQTEKTVLNQKILSHILFLQLHFAKGLFKVAEGMLQVTKTTPKDITGEIRTVLCMCKKG